MSHDGWAALPCDATGLSAVCDCGISWSYSLTIFGPPLTKLSGSAHGSSSEAVVTRLICDSNIVFRDSKKPSQNKRFVCKHHAVSLSPAIKVCEPAWLKNCWRALFHYNMRQRLRPVCANVHSLLTLTHIKLGSRSGMSSITAFMLNGWILWISRINPQRGKKSYLT